jgi:hypothetical protein
VARSDVSTQPTDADRRALAATPPHRRAHRTTASDGREQRTAALRRLRRHPRSREGVRSWPVPSRGGVCGFASLQLLTGAAAIDAASPLHNREQRRGCCLLDPGPGVLRDLRMSCRVAAGTRLGIRASNVSCGPNPVPFRVGSVRTSGLSWAGAPSGRHQRASGPVTFAGCVLTVIVSDILPVAR